MKLALCFIAALSLALWFSGAQAGVTCEQFKKGLIEGLAQYQESTPRYEIQKGFSDRQSWFVRGTFDDVVARMACRDGDFLIFNVIANSADDALAALHVGLFAGVALHAFGLDWPQALSVRDELARTRRPATITRLPVGEGEASMAISFVDVPDFELNAMR